MNDEKTAAQAELLFNRLVKRRRHLRKWARRIGTDAFRLYDRDIPEIPLVLDVYGGAVSGALYKRPYEKDEREEAEWLAAMKAAAARALEVPESRVYLKERERMRNRQETGRQYEKMDARNFRCDVHEGDLVFRVNLSDYLDTGLFLDARKKRALVREQAAGKRVLNLFAYTCTLSAAAARGGAARVDSVDLSNTYLDWGRLNFELNGLGAKSAAGTAAFIRDDALRFIAEAARKKARWDLIILDPPSFSNSKKMNGYLDIKRDHRALIEDCLALLAPDGVLYFSTNVRSFALPADGFPGFVVHDEGNALLDEDFRGKKTPACYSFRGVSPRNARRG